MRKMKVMLLVLALCLLANSALASFDLNATGSVEVLIHTADGVNVSEAHMALYRVGDPRIENSNLTFDAAEAFAGFELDWTDDTLAKTLHDFAVLGGIEPVATAETDAEGAAKFDGVAVGLYVVAQEGFSGGQVKYFSEIEPFILMMPMTNENGTDWTYDIEAQPKVNPLPTPTPSPTPEPEDPELPQTGMVRWPIPVLSGCGIVLFMLGWALVFMKKKKDA